MNRMGVALFKAKCLAVLDEVNVRRESIILTKRGKPYAQVGPLDSDADSLFGFMVGKGEIKGDIVAPVLTKKEWGSLG